MAYKRKTRKRISWKTVGCVFILGVFLIVGNYSYITYTATNKIYTESKEIPNVTYGLLLGTPKYLPSGAVNNYYKNRIESAIELYQKQKINVIIVSADTLNKYKEDEVTLIANDLIAKGVQASDLRYDRKGNSTWNSIQGVKQWCNGTSLILVISQRFHVERALYSAEKNGINALGYVAKGGMTNKLRWRELLARVKMQLDIMLN